MVIGTIIAALAAAIVGLAQQAGQSIQQWVQSPQGQQYLNNIVQKYGPMALGEILKKLGIK